MNTGMNGTGSPHRRWRPGWRVLLLLLLSCAGVTALHAQVPLRGTAEIGVIANLDGADPLDNVSIRLQDNTDRELLTRVAQAVADKLNAEPADVVIGKPDPEIVRDPGLGLECHMPVVPRVGGTLPIGPFIEALAPYARVINIVYVVQGPFTYTGYERFSRADVEYTVDHPEQSAADGAQPVAFYGVHAIIKRPTIQAAIPDAPPISRRRLVWLIVLGVVLAGIVGACVGLILVRLLPKRPAAARETQGAVHDRRQSE
jgi:hypothetical protein